MMGSSIQLNHLHISAMWAPHVSASQDSPDFNPLWTHASPGHHRRLDIPIQTAARGQTSGGAEFKARQAGGRTKNAARTSGGTGRSMRPQASSSVPRHRKSRRSWLLCAMFRRTDIGPQAAPPSLTSQRVPASRTLASACAVDAFEASRRFFGLPRCDSTPRSPVSDYYAPTSARQSVSCPTWF